MRCMFWPCQSMVGWGPGVPEVPGIQGLARGVECVPPSHSTWITCVMAGRILASSCTAKFEEKLHLKLFLNDIFSPISKSRWTWYLFFCPFFALKVIQIQFNSGALNLNIIT